MKTMWKILLMIIVLSVSTIGNAKEAESCALRANQSLEIDAPLIDVWDTALDVPTWPDWISFITYSHSEDKELTDGSKFKIKIKVKGIIMPFTLTVCEYDKYKKIAWQTGSEKAGFVVVRALIFEENSGKTIVTSDEVFTGPFSKFAARLIKQNELNKIHEDWLMAIKAEVKKREN